MTLRCRRRLPRRLPNSVATNHVQEESRSTAPSSSRTSIEGTHLEVSALTKPHWSRRLNLSRFDPRDAIVYISFAVLFLIFAITLRGDGFLSETNLVNIVNQTVPVALMACAFVFVLSSGEIDLSIGATVALTSLVTAEALHTSLLVGILAGLGCGLGIGLLNGLAVTLIRIPSFLVTLASMSLVTGLAQSIHSLQSISVNNEAFNTAFGSGSVGPFSTAVIWLVGGVIVAYVAFHQSRFGAHIRATGDNRGAAQSAGIRVNRVRVAALALSGLAAGLAGMLDAGSLQTATYTFGTTDLLTVIAAVIIGGTSLFGGRGTIIGALFGSLLLGMLANALILMGLSVPQQSIALGVLILLAVAFGRDREGSS
jgi:ribose transport system permease protein